MAHFFTLLAQKYLVYKIFGFLSAYNRIKTIFYVLHIHSVRIRQYLVGLFGSDSTDSISKHPGAQQNELVDVVLFYIKIKKEKS